MSDHGAAEYLRDHPLLNEIFDGLERQAMETAIYAHVNPELPDPDLEMRRAMLHLRAIRDVRAELELRAKPQGSRPRRAVA